jgi:hypothetical protein
MGSYNATQEATQIRAMEGEGSLLSLRFAMKWVSPYKLALVLTDLLGVFLGVWVSAWVFGFGPFILEDANQAGAVLIASSLLLAFFQDYRLYNYHVIFSPKRHMAKLCLAFQWGIVSLGFTVLFLKWHALFRQAPPVMEGLLLCVALTLLSRVFWEHAFRIAKSLGLGFLTAGVIICLCSSEEIMLSPHCKSVFLGLPLGMAAVLAARGFLVHTVFNRWLRRRFRRQVLIVGSDEEARGIARHVIENKAPIWVAGVLSDHPMSEVVRRISKDRLGGLEDLPTVAAKGGIDEIVVTDETIDRRRLISLLDYCTSNGITVWFPPKFMPIINIKLDIARFCGLPAIRLNALSNAPLFRKIKLALDALIALPAIALLAPLFLMVAAAIKIDSPGPVFYRARALGKNGREFTMYKFRSMRADNDCRIHKDYVSRLIKGEIGCGGGKTRYSRSRSTRG